MRILLLALLVVWAGAYAETPLEADARELRQLRQVRGWFSGGPAFVDAVDKWGGRKQKLMDKLAEQLDKGQYSPDQVVALLGEPDQRVGPKSPGWGAIQPKAGELLLVYYWRGGHDYLYFICRKGRVTGSDWWMAGE